MRLSPNYHGLLVRALSWSSFPGRLRLHAEGHRENRYCAVLCQPFRDRPHEKTLEAAALVDCCHDQIGLGGRNDPFEDLVNVSAADLACHLDLLLLQPGHQLVHFAPGGVFDGSDDVRRIQRILVNSRHNVHHYVNQMNGCIKFCGEIRSVLYGCIRAGKEIDRAENSLDCHHGIPPEKSGVVAPKRGLKPATTFWDPWDSRM